MKQSAMLNIPLAAAMILGGAASLPAETAPEDASASMPLLPVTVMVKSPAETQTEMQIICLFRSKPGNKLRGSLDAMNDKLHGLLGRLRNEALFGGELGETLLLTPPSGTLGAKRLLLIGLGDPESFRPERMVLVGKIALREANRMGIAHPFFAPTVLDGGVSLYTTGQIAEEVVRGFREALATEEAVRSGGASATVAVRDFTYLAGADHARDTETGIDRALGLKAARTPGKKKRH